MAKANKHTHTETLGSATSSMGVRATANYLAKQRESGWPGSVSIKNKSIAAHIGKFKHTTAKKAPETVEQFALKAQTNI